ncbi:MAG: DegT/DnrJ/EryC1/StrS family aminotransferase [Parvularculaceae bacterium]
MSVTNPISELAARDAGPAANDAAPDAEGRGAERDDFGRDGARAPIRSAWPTYAEDEVAAAMSVLRSGRVNALQHGERNRAFEAAFARLCRTNHAIAVANGTLGLELALRAFELGPGDDVVVTSRSFIASASCVVNAGAAPVFADVDPDTQNLTAETVAEALTERTKAIIVVHLAGRPCEMDELAALAKARGLVLIEDCAQAHGATYRGRPVGGIGDAGVFSFCTDKIMSTGGEGGMLVLNDDDAWSRAWSYKDHGKSYDLVNQRTSGDSFRWVHASVGTNFRLTEMQAAIGLRQLAKLPEWVAARRERAAALNAAFAGLDALRAPVTPSHLGHAFYKYYAFVVPEALKEGWSRDRILREAGARGAPCQSGSCPEIYREQAFSAYAPDGHRTLPTANALGAASVLIPVDHTIAFADVERVGDIVRSVVLEATR